MKLSLLVCALAVVAGCKNDKHDAGSSSSDKVASCLMTSMQTCREYRGGNLALGTESLQKLCSIAGSAAAFTETACPVDKLIGTCAKHEGKDFFYEGYFEAPAKIEESCKQSGGTFAAK